MNRTRTAALVAEASRARISLAVGAAPLNVGHIHRTDRTTGSKHFWRRIKHRFSAAAEIDESPHPHHSSWQNGLSRYAAPSRVHFCLLLAKKGGVRVNLRFEQIMIDDFQQCAFHPGRSGGELAPRLWARKYLESAGYPSVTPDSL